MKTLAIILLTGLNLALLATVTIKLLWPAEPPAVAAVMAQAQPVAVAAKPSPVPLAKNTTAVIANKSVTGKTATATIQPAPNDDAAPVAEVLAGAAPAAEAALGSNFASASQFNSVLSARAAAAQGGAFLGPIRAITVAPTAAAQAKTAPLLVAANSVPQVSVKSITTDTAVAAKDEVEPAAEPMPRAIPRGLPVNPAAVAQVVPAFTRLPSARVIGILTPPREINIAPPTVSAEAPF